MVRMCIKSHIKRSIIIKKFFFFDNAINYLINNTLISYSVKIISYSRSATRTEEHLFINAILNATAYFIFNHNVK